MSTMSEINKTRGYLQNAYDKLELKGATIPDDKNMKNLSDAIDSFQTGKQCNHKITNASYLFYEGARFDNLNELLEVCDGVTSTQNMFYRCPDTVTTLDLSSLDTSNVTNMANMFYQSFGLTTLNVSGFNTSNVTSMSSMFYQCSKLASLDVSSFDTSKVTTMYNLFSSCSQLTSIDVSRFNTDKVTNMQSMFGNCSKLTSLDLSNFDTSSVTKMSSMFSQCKNLTSLDVSNFDTSKVTTMSYMFDGCTVLTSLDLSNFDASSVTSDTSMFRNCSKLTDFLSFKNLGKGYTQKTQNYSNYKLDLSNCKALTHDSLMSVINNLYDLNLTYDVANGGTLYKQALTLGSTNLAKLTEDEIAIATNKGWNVT